MLRKALRSTSAGRKYCILQYIKYRFLAGRKHFIRSTLKHSLLGESAVSCLVQHSQHLRTSPAGQLLSTPPPHTTQLSPSLICIVLGTSNPSPPLMKKCVRGCATPPTLFSSSKVVYFVNKGIIQTVEPSVKYIIVNKPSLEAGLGQTFS